MLDYRNLAVLLVAVFSVRRMCSSTKSWFRTLLISSVIGQKRMKKNCCSWSCRKYLSDVLYVRIQCISSSFLQHWNQIFTMAHFPNLSISCLSSYRSSWTCCTAVQFFTELILFWPIIFTFSEHEQCNRSVNVIQLIVAHSVTDCYM